MQDNSFQADGASWGISISNEFAVSLLSKIATPTAEIANNGATAPVAFKSTGHQFGQTYSGLHFNAKSCAFILENYGNCIDDPNARVCFAVDDYLVLKTFCSNRIEQMLFT